jgi:N-acetylneuraminate synthase/N,N'-diacetyllegionaminate synthase
MSMNDAIEIGGRAVGSDQPAFVIAEIGVNHDGSGERALELVAHAKRAGADAVKLQLFSASRLMHGSAQFAEYQRDRVDAPAPADMLRKYELSLPAVAKVVASIRAAGLVPLATPFSPEDVSVVEQLDLPAVKIASPDLVNWPLLQRAAASRRPLLVSCGAATMEETRRSAGWLRAWGVPFALLHCVSTYPVTDDAAHLAWIGEIAGACGCPVGYSDHTTNELAGALAVAAGACVVEKHLTYDRTAQGPDHSASADPEQFARYVAAIRHGEAMLGHGVPKQVLPAEHDVRRVSRQSLVLRRPVLRGERISSDDLTVQRPGTGIPAAAINDILGLRARHDLSAGTMLQWDMLTSAEVRAA